MRNALAITFLLAGAPVAHASLPFPSEIADHLGGDTPVPPCTICHSNDLGGLGTVVQPFGVKMMERGLVAQNVASLRLALDALEAEGSDVDGDGVPDIQELRNGTNPNPEGGLGDPPEYGCIGNVAPTRSAFPGATLSLVAALAAIGLRGRASRRAG